MGLDVVSDIVAIDRVWVIIGIDAEIQIRDGGGKKGIPFNTPAARQECSQRRREPRDGIHGNVGRIEI